MVEHDPCKCKAMRLIMAVHSFCRVGVDRECDVQALQWVDEHGILVGRREHDENTSGEGGLASLMPNEFQNAYSTGQARRIWA